jgi:hypothetical protein
VFDVSLNPSCREGRDREGDSTDWRDSFNCDDDWNDIEILIQMLVRVAVL